MAAGEGGDILEHLLAAVAKAGGLNGDAGEGAPHLVHQQGGQGLALHILGDDDELAAGLDHLLQQGEDLLNVGNLLIGDEKQSVVNDRLHLLGIGNHVGGDVATVELHPFHHVAVGLGGLGFLQGDNPVGGDLLHGLGDKLANLLIAGGDSGHAGDVGRAGDLLAVRHNGVHGGLDGALNALLHHHGVCAGGDVLHPLPHQGLGQQGGGGGAVAGGVVGLGGNFLHQLGAHVLKGAVQLDLLGDGDTVVGDKGAAELLIQHHVAALGPQGNFDGIGQLVDAGLERFSGFLTIDDLLCHNNQFLLLFNLFRTMFIPQRPGHRTGAGW